jgi:hypothetical protein
MIHIQQPQVAAHVQNNDRCREDGADRKAASHILKLRPRALSFRDAHRLERHSADRTTTRLVAANLRMHRARVNRAHRNGRARSARHAERGLCVGIQILSGAEQKFCLTAAATEVVGLAMELYAVRSAS